MDRNKASSMGRGGKGKMTQYPTDLFALGTKTTGVLNRDGDGKRSLHSKPSTSSSERKRDGQSSSVQPTKKPKLSFSGSPGESTTALDIDPVDLVPAALNAYDNHNTEKLVGLLGGAIWLLKSQRWKPDPILCHGMIYLAKMRPGMFGNETVMQGLCGLLKREQGTAFKSKGNPVVFVLACSLLYAGHKDSKNWPDAFIKVYIEDALNERWWVDCTWCKCFVDNIVTAFLTVLPPSHLMPNDNNTLGTLSPSGSPSLGVNEEESDTSELDFTVFPRYSSSYDSVEAMVLEAIKEQLGRRAAPDAIGKGFLKLLSSTCGSPEIRMIAACRLESWLHSGKLWRPAQELLAHVAINISSVAPRDQEVLAQLVKMRLKTKPLVNGYLTCLREMVSNCPATLRSVVMHTIYNELSNVRNPNSMAAIASLIQAQPQAVPQAMADTFQELLMRPEEYLRSLRSMTREAVRAGRAEGTQALLALCRGLVAAPTKEMPAECREKVFHSIADLLSLCIMLTASHAKHHPDYRMQIASIQCDGIWWLNETAIALYRPPQQEYVLALHKIMFLENVDTYCKLDNWPPESERALAFRVSCEVPLLQNTLIGILFIGLSKELPFTPGEALELCEQLVRRACALTTEENPLPLDKTDVADYIFQLCQYHHPENITLPQGYVAPSLAITSLYWRAWMVLVMIAAHNPHTFSRQAFDKYPTLKALIEMCITNKWNSDEWVTEIEGERQAVLQFEGHLAAASSKVAITEHTSRLLCQLMLMDPSGPARRPPPSVLECLQALNKSLRLGHLLCRQPTLLLDIISRQGTQRAMPWLQDLLHNSEHSLSVLPVQCLCEFLVVGGSTGLGGKTQELVHHLRQLVNEASTVRDVLTFFLQRLTDTHPPVRHQANRGLKLVLSPITAEEPTDADWNINVSPEEWLSIIPSNRHWLTVRDEVVAALRGACLVETEPGHLNCYILFLAQHVQINSPSVQQMQEIVFDVGTLVVERMVIMAALVPAAALNSDSDDTLPDDTETSPHHILHALNTIFHNHLQKVREPPREAYDWCSSQDQIFLQWPSGEECTLHILVVHAMVMLLTYGPSKFDKDQEIFNWFLSIWFGPNAPKAYLVDTSEEALLFPDWMKLKMMRSNQPVLIQAGLKDLEASQLVLFIQSFGIPINSMSALLSALDDCSAETMANLVVERPYMAQLVAVQWRRGARGGRRFYAALGLQEPLYPEEPVLVDDPLPPLPLYGANTDDEWKLLTQGPQADTKEILLEEVGPLFATTFMGATTYEGNINKAFVSLQKIISTEVKITASPNFAFTDCPYIQCIVIYLGLILESPKCYQFTGGFLQCVRYSCPLVRLLLHCRQTPFDEPLSKIAETLLGHYQAASSPLVSLLKSFSERKSKTMLTGDRSIANSDIEKAVADKFEVFKRGPGAKNTKEFLVTTLESCPINVLEHIGRHLIDMHDTKTLMEAMVTILEKQQAGNILKMKTEPDTDEKSANNLTLATGGEAAGLIIDWMADLQPELLGDDPKAQMKLMFRSGGAPWQELLVALLAHRASWRTLYGCMTALLAPDCRWEANTVLELIGALTKSPRIWQGRDKTTPKHHTPENILRLNHEQIGVLISYILEEAEQCLSPEQACLRIESRLPLLLESLQDDHSLLSALNGLEHRLTNPDHTVHSFLVLLYMRVPKILNLLTYRGNTPVQDIVLPEADDIEIAESSTSIVDRISHCMFTALAATPHSKEWIKRIPGLEASCRSLCRQHPRLALRQLGLLGTLLKGRCHLEWGPFRNGGHATYFSQTLNALEMLQPTLFAASYKKKLHSTLDSYFALISKHGHIKDLSSLIQRFATLLQGYMAYDAAAANDFLRDHHHIMNSHPTMIALNMGGAQPPIGAQHQQHSDWDRQSDRTALQNSSNPSPLTLLNSVITSSVDTNTGLSALMRCLDASNPELAISALEKLPELVVCMQEHASQILAKVFELGMKSKINTESYIAKCIMTLNAHRGC